MTVSEDAICEAARTEAAAVEAESKSRPAPTMHTVLRLLVALLPALRLMGAAASALRWLLGARVDATPCMQVHDAVDIAAA